MATHNRAAAFLEFLKGTTLEDISHGLAIPLDQLQRWKANDGWERLRGQADAPALLPTKIDKTEQQLERINANREKNLVIAQKLQDDLLEVIDKMRSGRLRVKRAFANGTQVELEPSLRDRCDLALYAKNVADISYRALGDVETAKNSHADTGLPSAGQITIVLPPLLSGPREKQAVNIESEVIAIDAEVIEARGNGSPNHSPERTEAA